MGEFWEGSVRSNKSCSWKSVSFGRVLYKSHCGFRKLSLSRSWLSFCLFAQSSPSPRKCIRIEHLLWTAWFLTGLLGTVSWLHLLLLYQSLTALTSWQMKSRRCFLTVEGKKWWGCLGLGEKADTSFHPEFQWDCESTAIISQKRSLEILGRCFYYSQPVNASTIKIKGNCFLWAREREDSSCVLFPQRVVEEQYFSMPRKSNGLRQKCLDIHVLCPRPRPIAKPC